MNVRDEFEEIYNQLSKSRQIYMSLKEIKTGIPRWRLSILEKGFTPTGGDGELLCIERDTEEECMREGIKKMKKLLGGEGKC